MERAVAFNLASNAGLLEIDAYDVIGEAYELGPEGPFQRGLTAKDVLDKCREYTGAVLVRINSTGGNVMDGLAIYNILRDVSKRGGKVTTRVDGLAASAASIIACGGDDIRIASNGLMFIHRASTMEAGNAEAMRKRAQFLETVDRQIVTTYQDTCERMGRKTSVKDIEDALMNERCFTAKEAVEFGIAGRIVDATKATNSLIEQLPDAMQAVAKDAMQRIDQEPDGHPTIPAPSPVINLHITIPAQSGPEHAPQGLEPAATPATENNMSEKLISALGAKTEDEALNIANQTTTLVSNANKVLAFSEAVCALAGGLNGEAALGALNAMKADAARLPTILAERDAALADIAKRDADALLARKQDVLNQIRDAGKATAAELELMQDQSLPYLEGWLAKASVRVPGAGQPPVGEPPKLDDTMALTPSDEAVMAKLGITKDEFLAAKRVQLAAAGALLSSDEEDK